MSVIRSCKGNRDSSLYFPFTLGLPLNFMISRRSQKDFLNRRKIQSTIKRKFTSGKVLCKSLTAGSSYILRLKIARSEHLNCPWGNIDIQHLFAPTNVLFVWTPILSWISEFKWYSLHPGFSIEVLPLNRPFPCSLSLSLKVSLSAKCLVMAISSNVMTKTLHVDSPWNSYRCWSELGLLENCNAFGHKIQNSNDLIKSMTAWE